MDLAITLPPFPMFLGHRAGSQGPDHKVFENGSDLIPMPLGMGIFMGNPEQRVTTRLNFATQLER